MVEAYCEEVRAWVSAAWPDRDWRGAEIFHGAFHEVVVARHAVARVAQGNGHQQRVDREARVLGIVAQAALPIAVPSPLSGPVSRSGRSGLLTTVIAGQQLGTAPWPEARDGFSRVLKALRQVPAERLAGDLPPPRSWCGGTFWPQIVHRRLRQHLPAAAATRAAAVVRDVIDAEQLAAPGLVHGDLGLHNVLWDAGRLIGVIDLDHACWGDPAMDVAPLVGTFTAQRVAELVDALVLDRATLHRASLSLQVAAAAELTGNNRLRDHALQNFITRLDRGTLYDPGGARPLSRSTTAE